MGDWVRRICYPMFLPAIVLTVWAHAWSAKMEASPVRFEAPAGAGAAASASVPRNVGFVPPDYGLSHEDDDGFASAEVEAE
jgi:hypothetical protein